jgi:hypothetical protein
LQKNFDVLSRAVVFYTEGVDRFSKKFPNDDAHEVLRNAARISYKVRPERINTLKNPITGGAAYNDAVMRLANEMGIDEFGIMSKRDMREYILSRQSS